jgi:hypothetical protein
MGRGPTNRIVREAFITGPKTAERVQRLNAAALEREILPVVGISGTGKDRFLDWWWQQGCADKKFAGDDLVSPHDIIVVEARPARATTISVSCLLMNAIWHALLELQRARENGELPKPVREFRSLKTDRQLVSLMDDGIARLMRILDPLAIVVLDAHLLDSTALNHVLKFRMSPQRGKPLVARRALILCSTEDVEARTTGPLGKLMDKTEQLRRAWYYRLVFPRLNETPKDEHGKDDEQAATEFDQIMVRLLRQNLNAVFGADVDQVQCLEDFATWTTASWHFIVDLVGVLDVCLGPVRNEEPRQVTEAVMTCVKEKWLKRTS